MIFYDKILLLAKRRRTSQDHFGWRIFVWPVPLWCIQAPIDEGEWSEKWGEDGIQFWAELDSMWCWRITSVQLINSGGGSKACLVFCEAMFSFRVFHTYQKFQSLHQNMFDSAQKRVPEARSDTNGEESCSRKRHLDRDDWFCHCGWGGVGMLARKQCSGNRALSRPRL